LIKGSYSNKISIKAVSLAADLVVSSPAITFTLPPDLSFLVVSPASKTLEKEISSALTLVPFSPRPPQPVTSKKWVAKETHGKVVRIFGTRILRVKSTLHECTRGDVYKEILKKF